MRSRPYKVTLEKIETHSTVQHHDTAGNYTTEIVTEKVEYEIVKIQNLVSIEISGGIFRVGDRMPEEVAEQICRSDCYDVTVTR